MLPLILLSLVAPSTSQLLYYYLYPSYYPTTPVLQNQSPAYAPLQQQTSYICGSPPNYQFSSIPCTTANYDPNCDRECQSTPYCQRFDSAAQCVNGCCNSSLTNSNSSSYNPNQNQNTNGINRDNSVNDLSCPFNDPNGGVCVDGNCPEGFVCNADSMCCPCSVGAAHGACSAGACSTSALRCETASGMCCPRPINGTTQYTPGLQQQQHNTQQQQMYPQQQQQYNGKSQQPNDPQQQFQQQQQPYNGKQSQQQQLNLPYQQQPANSQQQQYLQQPSSNSQFQQQPQQQYNYDYQYPNQNQNRQQFGQQSNFNGQQPQFNYNTQSPNQFQSQQSSFGQQSSSNGQQSNNPTTPFVYNTQNPNPSSTASPPQQGSTTTVQTIYPSSG